jgi:hypothetical protein
MEYAKTSYEYEKRIIYNFLINAEQSGLDLGLATGGPDVRAFDLGAPFLSLSPSFALLKYIYSLINFI